MKKILFAILVCCSTLASSSKDIASPEDYQEAEIIKYIELVSNHFKCDGRQYCSQMTSREEAEFFIKNCPNTKMDGDKDGIPCENDSRF